MDVVQELIELARQMGVPSGLADQLDREVRRRFGGEQVYIKSRPPVDDDAIRAMAHQLRSDGHRYRKIAEQYGLSERRVRQIVDG